MCRGLFTVNCRVIWSFIWENSGVITSWLVRVPRKGPLSLPWTVGQSLETRRRRRLEVSAFTCSYKTSVVFPVKHLSRAWCAPPRDPSSPSLGREETPCAFAGDKRGQSPNSSGWLKGFGWPSCFLKRLLILFVLAHPSPCRGSYYLYLFSILEILWYQSSCFLASLHSTEMFLHGLL